MSVFILQRVVFLGFRILSMMSAHEPPRRSCASRGVVGPNQFLRGGSQGEGSAMTYGFSVRTEVTGGSDGLGPPITSVWFA